MRRAIHAKRLSARVQAIHQVLSMIGPEEKAIGVSDECEASLKEAYARALWCEKQELLWNLKEHPQLLKLIISTEFEIQEEIGDICRRVFDYFEDAQRTLGRVKPY